MAPAPTTSSNPTHRRSVRVVVAAVVLALVGAVVVLADDAGERRPIAPSLRPVLLAAAGVPSPPPLGVGAISVATDDAEDGSGVADVDAAVEAASTGAPVPAPPSPPSVPADLDPAPAVPAAPPTTEPPMPEPPPAAAGTLQILVTPADDGASRQVWVQTSEGATVLERVEVAGPVVIELAPGTYAVFIENTGPPYGPDEHGIALGGGSNVTRDVVEVVAGRTTTVTCSTC